MTLGDNLNKKIPGASVGIFQVIPYLKKKLSNKSGITQGYY